MKRILVVLSLTVLLGSCGYITGPNRMIRVLGNEAVEDYITFEGTTLSACSTINVPIENESVNLGCIMNVQLFGGKTRGVMCTGRLYNQCMQIPLGSRVSINGELLSNNTLTQANHIEWRRQ